MSIKLYHRLRAATKSQRFSVCSVCTKDLDVVHAFSRRSILNFDDAADCCVPDDGYLHAEEVNPPLAHVSVEEFHDISTQHARKWDFGYLTGIFELKPIPASSYDFSTTTRVPQKNQIDIPSRSMLICSGFDLNVKNEKLMDASGLHEGISWSLSMSDETSQSAKNSREHLEQVYDIVRAVVGTFKNGTRRACPLFVYLVVWAPKDYITHTARYFYEVPRVKVNSAEVHAIEFSMNHFFFMTRESKAQKQRPVGLDNHINEGIISDTTHFMILKDVKVSQSPKYESQERRPVVVNLNGDFVSQLPIISDFVKSAKGWSIFAKSRARREWIESLESDFISESIVEFPIMSNPAGFLAEFDLKYECNLEPVLCSIPYAISCGIHGDSRPASMRVAHNPSLLLHVGTVPKSPVGCTLYGLFKPLLMIAQDMSRFRTSMELSSLTQVPLAHLDTDLLDAVQHSFHRLRSLCVE